MSDILYYHAAPFEIIHLKNKPIQYKEHNHLSVYTIGLVLEGEVALHYKNSVSLYPSNSYFMIAPYQVHSLSLPATYEIVTICLKQPTIQRYKEKELLILLSKILPAIAQDIPYAMLTDALHDVYHSKVLTPSNKAMFSSALSLYHSPEKNGNLAIIASTACYSPYHFIKVFKQAIGVTPHRLQLQSRVRKAQRMLEQGQEPSKIAIDLGFYDQSHFSKCFKNIVGFTPIEYRKRYRKLL